MTATPCRVDDPLSQELLVKSPHFANLYDLMAKYADVLPVAEVVDFLERYEPPVS